MGSVSSPFRAYQQNKQSAVCLALSVVLGRRTSEYDDPGSDRVRSLISDKSQAENKHNLQQHWKIQFEGASCQLGINLDSSSAQIVKTCT